MFSSDDHRFMARALRLARRGLFTTTPNPRVGCVIVREGQLVGEGWHRRTGEAHAEVLALEAAGAAAAGATAYVTLEPCCHHGRTPPCTEAQIKAGVRRVVDAVNLHDDVVLLGSQGSQTINAQELAEAAHSISYEILCGISSRVPRQYVNGS